MPSLADLFQPSQSAPPPPEQQQGLREKWALFMANPDNKAGLLQFGISMMAPSAGPSLMGHFAQALGEAGQTVDQRVEQRNKEAETALNSRLATSRLDLSERELAERQRQNQIDEELAREATEINRYEADTSRLRIGADRRGLTANQAINARQDASKMYQEGQLYGTVPEDVPEDVYVAEKLKQWGVPDVVDSGVDTSLEARMNPDGDLTAAAADAPRELTEPARTEAPRPQVTTIDDHRQQYPGTFDAMITQVNKLRQSGSTANLQLADIILQKARKLFVDPTEIDKFLVPIGKAAAATPPPKVSSPASPHPRSSVLKPRPLQRP